MVNSSVPIVVLPFISVPSLPRAGLAAAAPAGSQEGSHPAWCPAQSLPSFLTPIWPSSEPPAKGNYTTGPDCACRYCFMAELFRPAPSPAFAHASTQCSMFNRWRKGTLREIKWLPATGLFPAPHWIGREPAPGGMCAWGGLELQEIQMKPSAPPLEQIARQPSSTVPQHWWGCWETGLRY